MRRILRAQGWIALGSGTVMAAVASNWTQLALAFALILNAAGLFYLAEQQPREPGLREELLRAVAEKEGYGLQLMARIFAATGRKISPGVLYPTMRAMEREGLVESYEGPPLPERGNRPRIFYRITDAGKAAAKLCLPQLHLRGRLEQYLQGLHQRQERRLQRKGSARSPGPGHGSDGGTTPGHSLSP